MTSSHRLPRRAHRLAERRQGPVRRRQHAVQRGRRRLGGGQRQLTRARLGCRPPTTLRGRAAVSPGQLPNCSTHPVAVDLAALERDPGQHAQGHDDGHDEDHESDVVLQRGRRSRAGPGERRPGSSTARTIAAASTLASLCRPRRNSSSSKALMRSSKLPCPDRVEGTVHATWELLDELLRLEQRGHHGSWGRAHGGLHEAGHVPLQRLARLELGSSVAATWSRLRSVLPSITSSGSIRRPCLAGLAGQLEHEGTDVELGQRRPPSGRRGRRPSRRRTGSSKSGSCSPRVTAIRVTSSGGRRPARGRA